MRTCETLAAVFEAPEEENSTAWTAVPGAQRSQGGIGGL